MLKFKSGSIIIIGFILFLFLIKDLYGSDPKYQMYLNGHKLDFQHKALKVSEFAPLVITLSNSQNKIQKLKVTLARGNRPVDIKKTSGNQFNLGKFKRVARPGDRLIFEIFTADKSGPENSPQIVITIPVI